MSYVKLLHTARTQWKKTVVQVAGVSYNKRHRWALNFDLSYHCCGHAVVGGGLLPLPRSSYCSGHWPSRCNYYAQGDNDMYNLNNIQSFCELIFNLSSKSEITNNWPMEAKLANKDNNKYQNSNHLSLSEPRDLGPRTSFWKPVSGLENSSASYSGDRDRKAKNWAYMDFSLFCHQNCSILIIFTHLPVQPCFSLDGTV